MGLRKILSILGDRALKALKRTGGTNSRRVQTESVMGALKAQNRWLRKRHALLATHVTNAACANIYASERAGDPKRLLGYGAKVYSQCDEDGIIREVFRRIGTNSKRFVEIGCGDGTENNTLALLLEG